MATKKAIKDEGKQKKSPKVLKGKIGTPKKILDDKTGPRVPKVTRGGQLIIQGKITDQTSAPRPGLTVKAFDRNVGADDTLLGQTATDAQGQYSISYTLSQLKGKPAADLGKSVV